MLVKKCDVVHIIFSIWFLRCSLLVGNSVVLAMYKPQFYQSSSKVSLGHFAAINYSILKVSFPVSCHSKYLELLPPPAHADIYNWGLVHSTRDQILH